MVRGAAEAAEHRDEGSPSEPTFLGIFMTGLPGFLREGFLPLGAFYAGLRLQGLAAGIVASAAASLLVYLYERRAGRDALLVRLSLGPCWSRPPGDSPSWSLAYFLARAPARSALRLAILLNGSLESSLLITLLTGTPAMLLLLAWSIRYALRGLAVAEAPLQAHSA